MDSSVSTGTKRNYRKSTTVGDVQLTQQQPQGGSMAKRDTSADKKPNGSTQGKPNILIIWGDDIGWSNLSCYNLGMMGYRTPNIEPLPHARAVFVRAHR